MRKSRFAEEQIVAALKEHEAGARFATSAASSGSASRPSTCGFSAIRPIVRPMCGQASGVEERPLTSPHPKR